MRTTATSAIFALALATVDCAAHPGTPSTPSGTSLRRSAAATAPIGGAVAPVSVAELTTGLPDSVRRDVERLRRATNAFHDFPAAAAAGYPTSMASCAADSTMGAMGYHFVDRPAFDAKLDVEHPEMLVYEPKGDGRAELVAVEYVVPYQFAPRDGPPPHLFGRALKQWDKFNYWEIHVWAWRKNPAGIFADWNPEIRCPKA